MNAVDTQLPIATEPESKSEGFSVIGVHVGTPVIDLIPQFCPKENFIGGAVFARMMYLALLHAGVLAEDVVIASGDFNDVVVEAMVKNRAKAIETIRHELAEIGMLPLAQIGVREAGSWHCVFPSPTIRLNWLLDTERHQIRQQQLLQFVIERMAQLGSDPQNPGNPPAQE